MEDLGKMKDREAEPLCKAKCYRVAKNELRKEGAVCVNRRFIMLNEIRAGN